jgi:hypothetical protein
LAVLVVAEATVVQVAQILAVVGLDLVRLLVEQRVVRV